MKVVTIIQARMGSTRLPKKILKKIANKTVIERVIERCEAIEHSDLVVVATSLEKNDDEIQELCDSIKTKCFRGDLNDVRSRFLAVGALYEADLIIRVTGDNPLTSPEYADQMVDFMINNPDYDYCRMTSENVPYGSGAEVFKFKSLQKFSEIDSDQISLEHVTPAVSRHGKVRLNFDNPMMLNEGKELKVTIDTEEDFERVTKLIELHEDEDVLRKAIALVNNPSNTDLSTLLNLRKATSKDAELLFKWANDHAVRNNAVHQEPIIWDNHLAWYTNKLEDLKTIIYILEKEQSPVGQIRFDKIDAYFEIDYSINSDFRKQGMGSHLMRLGIKALRQEFPNSVVLAKVKETNPASIRIFEKLGFIQSGKEALKSEDYLLYKMKL